jgi:hypothetical protein
LDIPPIYLNWQARRRRCREVKIGRQQWDPQIPLTLVSATIAGFSRILVADPDLPRDVTL